MQFKKPEKKHIYISKAQGKYNLLSSDEQVRYGFVFPGMTTDKIKELGLKTYYLLNLNEDYGSEDFTAIEMAYELKDVFNSYLWHSDKNEINKLVEYLESIEEEQDELREQYDIDFAKAKIEYWKKKLEKLSS